MEKEHNHSKVGIIGVGIVECDLNWDTHNGGKQDRTYSRWDERVDC